MPCEDLHCCQLKRNSAIRVRRHAATQFNLPQFTPHALAASMAWVHYVRDLAERKGITRGSLRWLRQRHASRGSSHFQVQHSIRNSRKTRSREGTSDTRGTAPVRRRDWSGSSSKMGAPAPSPRASSAIRRVTVQHRQTRQAAICVEL